MVGQRVLLKPLLVPLLRFQEAVSQKDCTCLPGKFLRSEAWAKYLKLQRGENVHAEDMNKLQVLGSALNA